ncbi:oxidoreductase [Pseudomonas citronellolis]|uniref:oxidoreductase n=1 Tax=Pseudomonas citronellolis TaxID=53408 RepID=UPI0021BEDC35|nr:oxidoreductase [Pseudomonas citronellolis]UXJ50236.1 oxidoreductase [Pseudomonas citronellolis]
MSKQSRTWLITGVSSGLGRALAEAVLGQGESVIGTLRKAEQLAEFEALAPGRAFGCLLDVTDKASVHEVVTRAIEAAGGIDVVVNNAGYGLAGAAEEVSDAEARQQMETNFFGLVAVTQAALPFMRAQKRGHFINISSVAGFMGVVGMPIYSASKFAVEGFSESLAAETAHLGINVTIVEPGAFRTNWSSSAAIVRSARVIEDYAATAGMVRSGLEHMNGHQENDPAKGALAIITIVNAENPPLRLPLGADAVGYLRNKLASMSTELEIWEAVASNTRFD